MNNLLKKPDVRFTTCSVVMAVYKNDRAEWLTSSIDSILSQTVASNDIVIVRDGEVSSDIENTLSIYEKLPSVTVVRLEKNLGAGEARNVGLRLAKNELVAIMDADDIATPNRLELQLNEFNNNNQLTIVGGQIAEFENTRDNIVSYRNVPLTHDKIVQFSKRRSPFNNMCVCILKSHALAVGGYRKSSRAEDYNLWLELLSNGKISSNLSQVLCFVRIDNASLDRRLSTEQVTELLKLRYKYYRRNYIGVIDLMIASLANILIIAMPKRVVKSIYKKALRS